jgi:hypothetical protein
MKVYGKVNVFIYVFLTSALVRGEWSASRPGPFTPEKEPPVPIEREVFVAPRTGLDVKERKEFLPIPEKEL